MADSAVIVVSFARARSLGGAALWEYMRDAANAQALAQGHELASQDYHLGQLVCDRDGSFYQGTFPFVPRDSDFSSADFAATNPVP